MCNEGFAPRARTSELRSRAWDTMRPRKDEGGVWTLVWLFLEGGTCGVRVVGMDEGFELRTSKGLGRVGKVERMNLATLSKILAKITTEPHPSMWTSIPNALLYVHRLARAHVPNLLDSLIPDLPSQLTGHGRVDALVEGGSTEFEELAGDLPTTRAATRARDHRGVAYRRDPRLGGKREKEGEAGLRRIRRARRGG
ncbi:hypothetical protein PENSPDRAFT_672130 [Peniophora sp. CONT]|nr:hypothetical protein PENSPDRAFT_672130 [Peniophora sp. CONT]